MGLQSVEFTAVGAGTWQVPAGVSEIWLAGTGAGAGGYGNNTASTGSAAGGAGEWCFKLPYSVTPGATISYNIGAGGAAGTAGGGAGQGGGDTTFGTLTLKGAPTLISQTNGGPGGGIRGSTPGSNNGNSPLPESRNIYSGASGGGNNAFVTQGFSGGACCSNPGGVGGSPAGTGGSGGGGGSSYWGVGGPGGGNPIGNGQAPASSNAYGCGGGGARGQTNEAGGKGMSGYLQVSYLSPTVPESPDATAMIVNPSLEVEEERLDLELFGTDVVMPLADDNSMIIGTTWDPSFNSSGMTYSNGNNTVVSAGSSSKIRSVGSQSTGKFYVEVVMDNIAVNDPMPGVARPAWAGGNQVANFFDIQAGPVAHFYFQETTAIASGIGYANGDICQIAVDITNGKIWFGKNNVWILSGNPSTGANPAITGVAFGGPLYIAMFLSAAGAQATLHAGSGQQVYAAPTGFGSWVGDEPPQPSLSNEETNTAYDEVMEGFSDAPLATDVLDPPLPTLSNDDPANTNDDGAAESWDYSS